MMFDETSTMHYLIITFAPRHDRPGLFVICAHRCYSLRPVSLPGHLLDIENAHKRVSVVGEVQVHPIRCFLGTQDADCTSGMAYLHTRMR